MQFTTIGIKSALDTGVTDGTLGAGLTLAFTNVVVQAISVQALTLDYQVEDRAGTWQRPRDIDVALNTPQADIPFMTYPIIGDTNGFRLKSADAGAQGYRVYHWTVT